MKKELKDALNSVLTQSKFEGVELTIRKSEERGDSVLLLNRPKSKLGLIGLTEKSTIHAFSIDVNKWKWADSEGFTFDQVMGELSGEVFKEVRLHELIYELS